MSPRNGLRLAALCLALTGAVQLAGAASIQAKAKLAPVLIERAWAQSLAAGEVGFKPWPWADTFPVARLSFDASDKHLLVLDGDSGHALAFGPGHAAGSAPLGGNGAAVVGGHRDTHFAFLRDVTPGSEVVLELADGTQQRYRITHRRVLDVEQDTFIEDSAGRALVLVTCYPFDALLPGGPLRYVVTALPIG